LALGLDQQIAFDSIKTTIAKEVVLAYLDFTMPFDIYTNASRIHRYKIGTLSHSRNTKGIQHNAVGTKGKCLYQPLKSYKRQSRFDLCRVTHWRILLEEYAPKIIYIKRIHSTVPDAISRLDYDPKVNSTNEHNHATQNVSTKDTTCQKIADVLIISE
jgi:hypothetical protein